MAEKDSIVLIFKRDYQTKRKVRYNEELGDFAWSDNDVAIGYIYPYKQAMELIGNPEKVKITIEPV